MKPLVLALFSLAFALEVALAQKGHQPRIITFSNEISPDGSFSYSYQTEDGIAAQAQGVLKNAAQADLEAQSIQGQFAYSAPDGVQYTVSYTADENGFQPQGAHLPTPPPIPEAILRSLQYIQQNPDPKALTGERVIQPRFRLP